jgi:hypothetical protein
MVSGMVVIQFLSSSLRSAETLEAVCFHWTGTAGHPTILPRAMLPLTVGHNLLYRDHAHFTVP